MDVQAAESPLVDRKQGWLARERESGRLYRWLTVAMAAWLVLMLAFSIRSYVSADYSAAFLSPSTIAFQLVALLIPSIALMVLWSRRLAMARATERGLAGGRLHTRLVALFSGIAAVPTVMVAIFASLLFQSGLEFWFSDRARTMIENTVDVAQATYRYELNRVGGEATAMAGNLNEYLSQVRLEDARFQEGLGYQTYMRSLNEAALLTVQPDGEIRTHALVNVYEGMIDPARIHKAIDQLKANPKAETVDARTPNRISVLAPLDRKSNAYLYVARWVDPTIGNQITKANGILQDYRTLIDRSRLYQLRFNAALLIGSLVIVGLAIFFALKIADRLVEPVSELVNAAGRVEEGDYSARVATSATHDEIGILSSAFNRMTGRLQEQTGALVAANQQLDTRRAFIEAVLSSVTAGVIALDAECRILLVNRSAENLLEPEGEEIEGRNLKDVSPDLAEFMGGEARDADVVISASDGQRTLAVKRVRYADGSVLTFDDITDQLSDQRRAAWSDIARRIAHEIKNPLTPIQLAAERLQRRYGKEIQSDNETFERLTGTIVRQVGDLRRMVDEFSNFARMPKPVFREENVHEIARAALFLHEVAHPGINFSIDPPSAKMPLVCDRRQLGQALTNVVKNAVEAIEARRNRGDESADGDRVDLKIRDEGGQVVIDVTDTGVGLPEDRERLTEPYMTTRVRGTGLGLAIVKKIVEEHMGEIAFLDRAGGGTHVRIALDRDRLDAMDAGEPEMDAVRSTTADDGEYDEEVGD